MQSCDLVWVPEHVAFSLNERPNQAAKQVWVNGFVTSPQYTPGEAVRLITGEQLGERGMKKYH